MAEDGWAGARSAGGRSNHSPDPPGAQPPAHRRLTKKRDAEAPRSLPTLTRKQLGDGGLRLRLARLVGIPQHIAAAPYRLDVIGAAASKAQLLAQLTDEDVDDLEFGLVHAAIQMIEEHLLG